VKSRMPERGQKGGCRKRKIALRWGLFYEKGGGEEVGPGFVFIVLEPERPDGGSFCAKKKIPMVLCSRGKETGPIDAEETFGIE